VGLKADHITHESIGWDASVAADDLPGLGECDRVFDRHTVLQRILVDEAYALDEMNLITVWRARPVIRRIVPHTDRVDDKRVTLPVTDRIPGPSWETILFGQMAAAVRIDAAMLAAIFPEDERHFRSHDKFQRPRNAAHQTRHAMRQAAGDRVGEVTGQAAIELSLVLGFPFHIVGRVLAVARLRGGMAPLGRRGQVARSATQRGAQPPTDSPDRQNPR